jgi:hypothetical protein
MRSVHLGILYWSGSLLLGSPLFVYDWLAGWSPITGHPQPEAAIAPPPLTGP